MERCGLIKGRVKNENTLRPRQVFTITREGTRSLKEQLSQPITEDDIKWRLDELILRFAFMGTVLGKRSTLQFLAQLVVQVDAHIKSLKAHRELQKDHMSDSGIYALEYGIANYQAALRWAKRVMGDIQRK
jgi:DNA-binding PadR family transcriptional regulator